MKPTARVLFAAAFAVFAATASLAAHAQYQWIDANGSRVFSDHPPPPGTPKKNILKQPAHPPAPAAPAAPAATEGDAAEAEDGTAAEGTGTAAAPAAAPQQSAQDKALEEKLKKEEAAKEAQKKAEEKRIAAQKADNCKRAISAKAALDSGRRIAQTNAQGERSFMTPEQRAAETRRLNEIMRSECN